MNLRSLNFSFYIRIYTALALVAAAVFSSPVVSFVPLILLIWCLIQWRWNMSPLINLMTQCFMFFALSLLYIPVTGPYWPLLISLPAILLIDQALQEAARSAQKQETHLERRPTNLCITLVVISFTVLLVSIALNTMTLLASSMIIMLYLVVLTVIIFRYFPIKAVEEEQINLRVVAGKQMKAEAGLEIKTGIGARLFLWSRDDWLKVNPGVFQLQGGRLAAQISVTPTLAGPARVNLEGCAIDRWGLFQVRFSIQPVNLIVIPRARYAEWVADKYLEGTKPGELPLIANVSSLQTAYGLRRGIEYYGNQMYQPGDNLNDIDWKHSYKYNELIVKEYTEFHGQSVITLVNLVAGNDEEKDILAYNILVTAITLAQENIPVILAAYTDSEAAASTDILHGQRLVLQALKIVKEIVVKTESVRYLEPPNMIKLRANILRLQKADSRPAGVLSELLQMEYKNISLNARNSPLTAAFNKAANKTTQQAATVVISHRNHDAEALAFNEYMFSRNGTSVIYI
jgi:uncharacterized protein (DUF58 family)